MTIIGGSLADMWAVEDRGLPMAVFSGTVFIGPVLGPIIAGYLSAAGWRWNYYLLLIIVGCAWIGSFILLPETYVSLSNFSIHFVRFDGLIRFSIGGCFTPKKSSETPKGNWRSRIHD